MGFVICGLFLDFIVSTLFLISITTKTFFHGITSSSLAFWIFNITLHLLIILLRKVSASSSQVISNFFKIGAKSAIFLSIHKLLIQFKMHLHSKYLRVVQKRLTFNIYIKRNRVLTKSSSFLLGLVLPLKIKVRFLQWFFLSQAAPRNLHFVVPTFGFFIGFP